jgi:hypothetical protein
MILAKAIIKNKVGSAWWLEELKVPGKDIVKELNEILDRFNSTLRSHEKPRRIIMIRTKYPYAKKSNEHDWEKQNLVTIIKNEVLYDIYKCTKCHITGKRFGVSSVIQRDDKYKSKKYEFCR